MRRLEEFLDERELYIYRNYPGKTLKALGAELGIGGSRVAQIRDAARKKIRHEKIRELTKPWYEEEEKITLKRSEVFLIERALRAYEKLVEADIYQFSSGHADPDFEMCREIEKKLREAVHYETHPASINWEAYWHPDISDVK